MKRWSALLIAAALAVAPGACKKSSSGPSATDLSGTWFMALTLTESTCGSSQPGEVRTSSIPVEQSGQDVTFYLTVSGNSERPAIRGTFDGARVQAQGTYEEPPWSLLLTIDATVDADLTRIEGSMSFDWTNLKPRLNCMERGTLVMTR